MRRRGIAKRKPRRRKRDRRSDMGQPRPSRPNGLSTTLRKSSQITETRPFSENLCESPQSADSKKKIRFHSCSPRLKSDMSKAMTHLYILTAVLGLNALPIVSAQSDKSITIHQEIDFTASPQQLYEALLDTKQFAEFSGRPAEINREVGGASSLFKGHIIARNLELVRNQRIVQSWRVVTWPEGEWSIARFDLKPTGTGTHVVFNHIGFPDGLRDHLAQGWEDNYWSLLRKYFH